VHKKQNAPVESQLKQFGILEQVFWTQVVLVALRTFIVKP